MLLTTPWSHTHLASLVSEVERLFPASSARASELPVAVWAKEDSLAIVVEVPGVAKEDLRIEATADTLTVSGQRRPREAANGGTWFARERRNGVSTRTIALPWRIDPDQVDAKLVDGVLTVGLRRSAADRPRTIHVSA
jgi:HSP20 family protein